MVLELDTSGQVYKTTFILPCNNMWNKFCFNCKSWKCRGSSKECIMWTVNSADFCRGVGNFRLHFLSHFFFNFENLQISTKSKIFPKYAYKRLKVFLTCVFSLNSSDSTHVNRKNTIFVHHRCHLVPIHLTTTIYSDHLNGLADFLIYYLVQHKICFWWYWYWQAVFECRIWTMHGNNFWI